MSEAFDVRVVLQGTTTTICVAGEVDLTAVPSLDRAAARALARSGELLVVELSGTKFIDSTGICWVLRTTRRAREHGLRVVIVPAEDPAQEAFALAGLEDVLPFVVDHAERMAVLRR
jgi:anti-sigma B factor antagonist